MQGRVVHPPGVPEPAAGPMVTLDADGIVCVDLRQCDRLTLPLIESLHARHRQLCPARKSPLLLRGDHISGVDYPVQRFASSPTVCEVTAALALVVHSFLERHLARMFLMYHRPPYPAEVFGDEARARAWLRNVCAPG